MIEVRYSFNEAIDILGSRKELESLRQGILKFIETDSEKYQVDINKTVNPEPWDFVAKELKIIQSDKPVKVSISDDGVISIEGSKKTLEDFTSFLYFDEDARSGSHSHHEYYEGHDEWVSPDSFPLIIGIK